MGWSQRNIYLGVNLSPLLLNTLDIRFEYQTSNFFAIQLATGLRVQNRELEEVPRLAPLKDYIQPENKAIFLSIGARLTGPRVNNYPYIAVDITHVHYWEEVIPRIQGGKPPIRTVNDTNLGATFTIGIVNRIYDRLELDAGIQFGFAPPRSDLLAYYYPGMGYTTFGFSRYGIEGGHFQPILTLKYNLIKNRRQQLRRIR